VHYDLPAMLAGRVPSAEALRYAASELTRFIVLRKDGTGTPITIEQPACMVFHHGNLSEAGDMMTIDSILSPDDSILRYIAAWSTDNPPPPKPTQITRLTLDLNQRQITGRSIFGESQEFPRFDTRMSGKASRYLYTLEMGERFSLQSLIRHDLAANTSRRIEAGKGHAFEEAVFVPQPGKSGEDEGWLLHQGYSAIRDETFLDIRDAATLERAARVWTGQHFPVGFHGNFYAVI
jgi:carotenoid cleavage dioxygenase-like enzyme